MKRLSWIIFLSLWSVSLAQAQVVIGSIRLSADVSAILPFTEGGTVSGRDGSIFIYNPFTGTASAFGFLGSIDQSDIDAYHQNLYSLDTIDVVAGVTMYPNDVFSAFGNKELDGRASGIPDNVNIDAFTVDPLNNNLIISIDIPAVIDGQAFLPDDLIRFDGSNFSLFASLSTGLDLDAAHILSDQQLLVSFSTGGELPDGEDILDDDILRWDPLDNSYTLQLIPSNINDTWDSADVDALFATERGEQIFSDGFETE